MTEFESRIDYEKECSRQEGIEEGSTGKLTRQALKYLNSDRPFKSFDDFMEIYGDEEDSRESKEEIHKMFVERGYN